MAAKKVPVSSSSICFIFLFLKKLKVGSVLLFMSSEVYVIASVVPTSSFSPQLACHHVIFLNNKKSSTTNIPELL